ncbi:hypothetical protein BV25DRAFT_1835680 [Artomyces pyxidatus]|uniref:Uncharacterized protein n=1 Tax=Artomyces pyxidatus TaxID=48021 RepID=A0ACB8TE93_9AGAM|nr:hypothetical protein BV25DRAFT_1835680 [Artomyces pyxidatus]
MNALGGRAGFSRFSRFSRPSPNIGAVRLSFRAARLSPAAPPCSFAGDSPSAATGVASPLGPGSACASRGPSTGLAFPCVCAWAECGRQRGRPGALRLERPRGTSASAPSLTSLGTGDAGEPEIVGADGAEPGRVVERRGADCLCCGATGYEDGGDEEVPGDAGEAGWTRQEGPPFGEAGGGSGLSDGGCGWDCGARMGELDDAMDDAADIESVPRDGFSSGEEHGSTVVVDGVAEFGEPSTAGVGGIGGRDDAASASGSAMLGLLIEADRRFVWFASRTLLRRHIEPTEIVSGTGDCEDEEKEGAEDVPTFFPLSLSLSLSSFFKLRRLNQRLGFRSTSFVTGSFPLTCTCGRSGIGGTGGTTSCFSVWDQSPHEELVETSCVTQQD